MIALGTFLLAFGLSYVGTVVLLRVRLRHSFVDVPNERSSHDVPKPRFGGVAIVLAFTAVFLCMLPAVPGLKSFLPLLLGGLIVFSVGVVDDWRSLPVIVRFGAQILAAGVVIASGHQVDHIFLPLVGTIELNVLAVPFTVLFILGSINFYNFIDGIDGLAAGNAFIVGAFLALIAYMLGHVPLALVCLALAGSSVGFLQFNLPPSRLFMGDGGSTFLGFFFAYVAVAANGFEPELPFFIPVLMLSSLYLDAGLTLVRRALKGEKILQPHHTHYYQRLLSFGLNHKQVTALEYALTFMLGVSAVVFFKAGGFFPFFMGLCWIMVFVALILKIRSLERGDRSFWERRTLLVIAGDLIFVALAYFGAYFIRTNLRFTEAEGMAVLRAFPIVLVVRSACFYYYGLYRGVWKYTSTPDVLRIIKSVTMGSAILVTLMVLLYRFTAIPRSLFIIEYVLLIVAIGGSRFASRLFHEFGMEAHGADAKRIAIIGAGDYGERLGREIRGAEGRTAAVVCYLDDDKEKIGLRIQGVPTLGPISRLGEVCETLRVDSVVVGMSSLPDEKLHALLRAARKAGVPVEAPGGEYFKGREPSLVQFDRVSRVLDRRLPLRISETSARFFNGKRVLITHGGEGLGPPLVRELVGAGASVIVQIDSVSEAARFGSNVENCELVVGHVESDADTASILRAANPNVVLHCVDLQPAPISNSRDYLWRRVVRSTDVLVRALPHFPMESLVLITMWGNETVGAHVGNLAAVSEVLILNAVDVLPAAPRALRLPAVMAASQLAALATRAGGGDGVDHNDTFAMLESEAVALCLGAAANNKGRAIIVPRGEPPFSGHDVAAALSGHGRPRPVHPSGGTPPEGLLFPTEECTASAVPGAREIISAVYPASRALSEYISRSLRPPHGERLDDPAQPLHSALFRTMARSIRTGSTDTG